MTDLTGAGGGTLDSGEVELFAAMAASWWDAAGPMAPLHRMTPVRIACVRDQACWRFGRDPKRPRPLAGLSVLDVGCGGGIATEPLARLGANVTGIDPTPGLVEVARRHAEEGGLEIAYEESTLEAVADRGDRFDLVLALEVLELPAEVSAFLAA